MDLVSENVTTFDRRVEVVIKIVDMHIAITETPSRGNVEIAHNFVNTYSSLNAASFLSLSV